MTDQFVSRDYDACVIGSGPAGLSAAIELAEQGFLVALVESGEGVTIDFAQNLSDADIANLVSHSVMREAVRRGLGGTSAIWGGRCVPLDPIDFENRSFVAGSSWPFDADALKPFYERACQLLDVGEPIFSADAIRSKSTSGRLLSTNFLDSDELTAKTLERWSRTPNAWHSLRTQIEKNTRIDVLPGLTCVGFSQSAKDGAVEAAWVKLTNINAPQAMPLKAKIFIIACGGVESTRLVLNSMCDPQGLKLENPGLVGRYYMGHPSGKIADIELTGKPTDTLFAFEEDEGVYVRRRITFPSAVQIKNELLNIAFWLDNAPIADWRHGSGVLSAAYLALTAPFIGKYLAPAAIRTRVTGDASIRRFRHVWNCLRSPAKTTIFCFVFFYKRYLAYPRVPGFFTYSPTNRYALHYHAEQAPNWESTIDLSNEVDSLGLRKVRINLQWSKQDVDSIIKAHHVLDSELRVKGIGKLVYRYDRSKLSSSILDQAVDGFHQIGTLRMSTSSATGVTDGYGRLYGTSNCYVASSAVFPTSGQANPTLSLVAITVRQAKYIAKKHLCKVSSHA